MRTARAIGVFSLLAAATFCVKAETSDPTIKVNIPYTITVGSQQLAPGQYVFREISHLSNMFAIYKDGQQFEAFVHANPVEQLNAAAQTDLVLRSNGKQYTLDQVWFSGQKNGFQFVSPESVKARQEERSAIQVPGVKTGL
jgi:hypothetical protein